MSLPAIGILVFVFYLVVFAFMNAIPEDEDAGARLVEDDNRD